MTKDMVPEISPGEERRQAAACVPVAICPFFQQNPQPSSGPSDYTHFPASLAAGTATEFWPRLHEHKCLVTHPGCSLKGQWCVFPSCRPGVPSMRRGRCYGMTKPQGGDWVPDTLELPYHPWTARSSMLTDDRNFQLPKAPEMLGLCTSQQTCTLAHSTRTKETNKWKLSENDRTRGQSTSSQSIVWELPFRRFLR